MAIRRAHVLPTRGAGELNQALMELGSQRLHAPRTALRRLPRQPLVPGPCATASKPRFPRRPKRWRTEAVREAAVVVWRGGEVLCALPSGGRALGRPVGFSRFPLVDESPRRVAERLGRDVAEQTGVNIVMGDPLATIRHSVTRFRITLDVYHARRDGGRLRSVDGGELRWLRPRHIGRIGAEHHRPQDRAIDQRPGLTDRRDVIPDWPPTCPYGILGHSAT